MLLVKCRNCFYPIGFIGHQHMLIDLFGAITALLATYFFIRRDMKAWMIGLVATSCNAWLYWQKGIFADMCLEIFYFFNFCYGWYLWSQQNELRSKMIPLSLKQVVYVAGGVLILYCIIAGILTISTHSNVPMLDAATTALSITAQCAMCYKMMITWILWFCADCIYVILYYVKDLPFHVMLVLIYMGMAIIGFKTWRKDFASEKNVAPHADKQGVTVF
ncbi:nicotinamide riboside transporter PnuC [Legionella septentrionalis]|nr:nicotinamide riboside transporter PnuC [Legionella septentrionalis]RUR10459.1 nicotinamide riboside transporter PnuC [Legionella septentrionalis]RUR16079.1 nicotinamide riboside transporter PnuC [Legionella septentrionalis]